MYGDHCPVHDTLKSFSEWILSPGAIVILERLAKKYPRLNEQLLATINISVQAYLSSCADADDVASIELTFLNFDGLK
jgi:hypothetical protein